MIKKISSDDGVAIFFLLGGKGGIFIIFLFEVE